MQNNMFSFGNPIPQYGFQTTIPTFQNNAVQLTKVSGLDGAKAYQMPANSAVALFHESEDVMYIKTTDGAGFPTIKVFRFEPVQEEEPEKGKYVTIEEFNKFREEIGGKFDIRKKSTEE